MKSEPDGSDWWRLVRAFLETAGIALAVMFVLFVLTVSAIVGQEKREQPVNNYVTTGPQFNLSNSELNLYEARANAGDPEAALKLSSYYGLGIGVGEEAREASDYWYFKAAENGDEQTQNALVIENRWHVFPKDPAKAMKFMEEAAAKGWPGASYELREMRKLPTHPPPKEESPFDERGYRR
jgi:hypothetical protein